MLHDLRRAEAPVAWKQAMWGTPRGKKFLDRLLDFPTLDERIDDFGKRGKPWVIAEGFNAGGDGEAIDRPILHKLPYLPTRAVTIHRSHESK